MENATLYSSANALQRNDAARILRQIIPQLPFSDNHSARVLDIGCGSGDVTADILLPLLPKEVTQVVGVDKSEKMVQHARQLYSCARVSFFPLDIEDQSETLYQNLCRKINHHKNIKLDRRKSDDDCVDDLICDLKIDDDQENVLENENLNDANVAAAKFDFIFSIYCLHWVKNQRQALKNIYSLLKYRGEAVLIILAESEIYTMYQRLAEMDAWMPYMQDVKKFISPYHDAEDPAGMLSDHAGFVGFQVVTAECQQRTFVYRNYQALRDALKAVNPFYTRMSQQDGERFLDEGINVVKANNLAQHVDGHVVVQYSIVVARLRK